MKVLKYVICLLAMALLTVSSSAFSGAGSTGQPGQGEQHQKHTGGDGPQSAELSCLSAIASQNPVLILKACLDVDGTPDAVIQGAGSGSFKPGQGSMHRNHTGG